MKIEFTKFVFVENKVFIIAYCLAEHGLAPKRAQYYL
ncbi:hypothetical protein FUSO4_11395 [Fusobacterium necrophorum DJ-1]|uniref:Transcriptional regulator n=2 Tax=Fusobacterium necrophorum TaxID=859 RepID=A0AB73BVV4_9FUSO|nr:hypothetical protein FUSO4_11395 [Fusobacterium necrophorum DJ-1]KDE62642.1 hypothetical protein FUSO5_09385 [Fusobacterium necrophorum BFTR-1]KDE62986.1 hypothetical protein FUSO3_06335 [Fusobacterium necrophorum BL]KDE69631.1 hypothetical protein FUSO8_11190 [Fusobacterium necrophorum DJ-2]KDE72007.1 hypothetical protein FUSO7_08990 [Fusobacterium necrophorum BFTR-2]